MNVRPNPTRATQCLYCAARPIGLCGALGDGEAFEELIAYRRAVRVLDAGAPVYLQGQPRGDLFNLVSGWVVQYLDLDDGRRQVLRFLVPGALFGYEPAGVKGMGHSAQALTNASLCVIPEARVADLRQRHTQFNERYLWMIERDSRLALDHLASLGQRGAYERVAHLLLELAVRSGRHFPLQPGEVFKLPLTQLLIGEATGLTAVHVNRMLRRLREDHVLDFHAGRMTVFRPEELLAIAGVSEASLSLWTQPANFFDHCDPPTSA